MFGKPLAGSDGGAADAGEIVTIRTGDAFNDAEVAQASELSGQGGERPFGKPTTPDCHTIRKQTGIQILAHDGPSRTQIVTTDESKETWWTFSRQRPRRREMMDRL